MSGKNLNPINTHVPSKLAKSLGIKSNGSFRRIVDGEFIATKPEEAMIAASMGIPVASTKKSFDERWNGGKPSDPSTPGYMDMMANTVVNNLMGTNVQTSDYANSLFGLGPMINPNMGLSRHTSYPQQQLCAPSSLGSFNRGTPMMIQNTVPVVSHTSTTPVVSHTTSTTSVVSQTTPVVKSTKSMTSTHIEEEEDYLLQVAIAISKTETRSYSAPPPPMVKEDDDPIQMAIRMSKCCSHCQTQFTSDDAKFCYECGSRR